MGLVKEPLDVDFYFENRQMSDEDQKRVSDFIAKQNRLKQRHVPVKISGKNKRKSSKLHKKNELDVDFIGDPNNPLTEEEAKAISDYFKAQKAKESKRDSVPKKRVAKRKKSVA